MEKEKLQQHLTELRRDLHRHPEKAFEEVRTAGIVAEELKKLGLDVHTGIGKTGIVANLKVGDGTKVIGLRADMDCITINDKGNHDHVSTVPGKMHGCGHDGHTATLLGAAALLAERKDFNGTVRFIFQPAEEPGKGAQAMIDDGLFEKYPVDEIYGLHAFRTLPFGTINTCVGSMMASEDNFTIKITGKGGHASAPQVLVDPLVVASTIVLSLQTIVARNISPAHTAVVSVTEFETDGGHNAIPTHVELRGDTRSYSAEDSALIEKRMREICEHTCAMYGADCEFTYTHEFYPTINDEACVKKVVQAAKAVVGEDKVNANIEPVTGSEDFAAFLRYVPGCYVNLGTARTDDPASEPPVHNSTYDYNDDALIVGAEFWAELVKELLV